MTLRLPLALLFAGFVTAAAAQTARQPVVLVPPPSLQQPAPPPAADPPPPTADAPPAGLDLTFDTAILGGLDKVTARVVTITAPVGETVRLGSLEIVVRACKKHRPEDRPESGAFLDIWDIKHGQPAESVFRGWMFASSPALSAMEHPIYDVWVLDCRNGGSRSQR